MTTYYRTSGRKAIILRQSGLTPEDHISRYYFVAPRGQAVRVEATSSLKARIIFAKEFRRLP